MQGKIGNLKNISSPNNSKLTEPGPSLIKIEDKEVKVEIAKTPEERQKGLGGRTSLDQDSGMLFVFNTKVKPSFWMKDTKISLDFIWIRDGKIVGIDKNVQPQPNASDSELKLYPAPEPVDFVLEVNGGFSDKNGIKVGQSLSGLEQP